MFDTTAIDRQRRTVVQVVVWKRRIGKYLTYDKLYISVTKWVVDWSVLCRLCPSLCYCGMSAVTWWFLKSDLQGFWVGFPLVQWQFPPAKASMIGLMRHCCKWSKGVSWLCVLSVFISVPVPKLSLNWRTVQWSKDPSSHSCRNEPQSSTFSGSF